MVSKHKINESKKHPASKVWKAAAQFVERVKLPCRRVLPGGIDGYPLKEKQGLGTRCKAAGRNEWIEEPCVLGSGMYRVFLVGIYDLSVYFMG